MQVQRGVEAARMCRSEGSNFVSESPDESVEKYASFSNACGFVYHE